MKRFYFGILSIRYLISASLLMSLSCGNMTALAELNRLGASLQVFPYADEHDLPIALERVKTFPLDAPKSLDYAMARAPRPPVAPKVETIATSVSSPLVLEGTFPSLKLRKKWRFFHFGKTQQKTDAFVNHTAPVTGALINELGSHTSEGKISIRPLGGEASSSSTALRLTGSSSAVVLASVSSSVLPSATLPTLWESDKRPRPNAREKALIYLIQETNPQWDENAAHVLAHLIVQSSDANHIDYRILASLIATESTFKLNAVSKTGAKGLGQLKDATAQWLGVQDPFDPAQNLYGTAKYLSFLADQFPNEPAKAVASYFVGQGNVKRNGLSDDAILYVLKVQKHLDLLLAFRENA
ncbi:MAG: lytic transglycosylase domain-containing protein [Vampirovibrio sp.]